MGNATTASDKEARVIISRLRSRNGFINTVDVVELTAAGCMIEKCSVSMREDDRVLIRMDGLRYLPAIVVWIDEGRAGLAFEDPLYEPVLDYMLESFKVLCSC